MNILVACEKSAVLRDELIKRGHNAISCDLFPSDKPGPHFAGNALDILYKYNWDFLFAFPPCTYLANSGVQHLINGDDDFERFAKMIFAKRFFNAFLNAPIKKKVIENPIPHKYGLGKTYDQIIQPFEHGHMEQKSTCLWLFGVPKLKPTNNVKAEMMKLPLKERQRLWYASPGEKRAEFRSKTFLGIAKAMATQWC